MSLSKQWRGAYVCLCCPSKSGTRSFASNPKYSNSTLANQQPADGSSFVDPYHSYSPSISLTAKRDNLNGNGLSPPQPASDKGEPNTAEPPQQSEAKTGEKIDRRRCLLSAQLKSIDTFSEVTKKLSEGSKPTALLEDATKRMLTKRVSRSEKTLIATIRKIYSGKTVEDVARDSNVLQKLGRRTTLDTATADLVARLTRSGLLKTPLQSPRRKEVLQQDVDSPSMGSEPILPSRRVLGSVKLKERPARSRELRRLRPEERLVKSRERAVQAPAKISGREAKGGSTEVVVPPTSKKEYTFPSTIEAVAVSISALPRNGPEVPTLCHDLSRVLFNPGIYQLQDPRSRVYNFDPYLEKIMPVSEFDFKILKEYITSSRDRTLHSLALEHGKKYVGSSSSMTATLAQFHFLLSHWRDINTNLLSKGFPDTMKSFTIIQRSPSSVFLRYQDGVYAMDADKEYDSANILMSLGKSMEKLLTKEPQTFERYRKNSETKIPEEERGAPEAYQYTHAGDFLMRAQLDAYDPRLPGSGTFDLKTRAVASIRHNVMKHEEGVGYQIKTRFGDWESYEREYYDMMRSAFLKYSLQVRLGLMDGIFVAFHNIERIFGFQYVSLPEMDLALHGQDDTTLGDAEFKFSVELLNRILNRATERFPKRSLRLQFETRDLLAGGVFMQIFAVPMDEASIDAIQTSKKEAIDAFEQRLINPEMYGQAKEVEYFEALGKVHKLSTDASVNSSGPSSSADCNESAISEVSALLDEQPSVDGVAGEDIQELPKKGQSCSTEASNDSKTNKKDGPAIELLVLKLRIQNRVNGKIVKRPVSLNFLDNWDVDYSMEEETKVSSAQAQYRASNARRRTAFDRPEANSAANYYLRMLREMASRGAEWRRDQDERDAGRKQVVLYEGR
jgi:Mitochondrial protein Pet127